MKQFLKIVVTTPDERNDEADEIALILDKGIDFVHLRKPDWNLSRMEKLIQAIPSRYHNRLRLHSHFALIDRYSLAGAHLNSRDSEYRGKSGSLTRSCHSVEELSDIQDFDYVTLSPVFNSISKAGYNSAFDINNIATKIAGKNVIALGGVTPHHFKMLAANGFSGAAMLGYIWGATCRDELMKTLKQINNASVYN